MRIDEVPATSETRDATYDYGCVYTDPPLSVIYSSNCFEKSKLFSKFEVNRVRKPLKLCLIVPKNVYTYEYQ